MKTRIIKHAVSFCALLIAGVLNSSCNPELLSPNVSEADFSSIRIMNFNECGARPYDLYIYKENSQDSVIFRALQYGVGAAYATNLPPGLYYLQLRPINRPIPLQTLPIELKGRIQRTAVLWPSGMDHPVLDTLRIPDRNIIDHDKSMPYIRFLNTKNTTGAVDVSFDNPLNDPIFQNVAPKSMTDYVPLKHVLDTNYTIYLTEPGVRNKIVSRLAGAVFAPGSFYTIVFGGNDNNCRDTSAAKQDTMRIRYFDDNEAGNELSFPTPQSLRFNFVNGLINPQIVKEGQRTYNEVGIVINNEDRYLIPRMKAHDVGPVLNNVDESDSVVIPTGFFTLPWTDAVLISMYKVDGLKDQQRGTKLVNIVGAAMPNERITPDDPFSIVIMDTVSNTMSNGFPAIDKTVSLLVPLPAVAHPDSITLVLVNGLVAFKIQQQPGSGSTQSKFTINGVTPSFWSTPRTHKTYSWYTIHKDQLINGKIEVKAEIGRTTVVHTLEEKFVPKPGGVYEIVLVGQRDNPSAEGKPRLRILHTNPKRLAQ